MKTNNGIFLAPTRIAAMLGLMAGLLAIPTASAATHVVVNDDPLGHWAETVDCQSAPQFTSIQAALDASGAGASILVCPGEYQEDVQLNNDNVSLEAADLNKKPRLVGQGTMEGVINVSAFGVLVIGFDVSQGESGIRLSGDFSEIRYNKLHDNGGHGIHIVEDASDHLIEGNESRNNGNGIRVDGNDNVVRNNEFTRNDGDGIFVSGANNEFSNNRVSRNYRGFYLETGADHNVLSLNEISRNRGSGIELEGIQLQGNQISKNRSYKNSMHGITLSANTTLNVLQGNEFHHNGGVGIHCLGAGNVAGLDQNQSSHNKGGDLVACP